MKNAVLLHGLLGNPDNFWFGWLRTQLAAERYQVSAPQLPGPDKPNLAVWTDFALKNLSFDADTLIIAHSAGCPLTLSLLNELNHAVHRTILVAGFIRLKEMNDDDVEGSSNEIVIFDTHLALPLFIITFE